MIVIQKKQKRINILIIILITCIGTYGQKNSGCKISLSKIDVNSFEIDKNNEDIKIILDSLKFEESVINDSLKLITFDKINKDFKTVNYELLFLRNILISYKFKIFKVKDDKEIIKYFNECVKLIINEENNEFIDNYSKYSFLKREINCEKFFRLVSSFEGFFIEGGVFKINFDTF